jgi:uncharacterized protein with GYD domain
MIFITFSRLKRKPTKDMLTQSSKFAEQMNKEGIRLLGLCWTLGSYDSVAIMEAPDEKAAMRAVMRWGDIESTETLVAVSREEATKLVE